MTVGQLIFKSLVNYDSFSKIFLLTPNFNYGAAMLPANHPIMKTIRRYAHKAFYGRKTREWGTHFHNFYWPSFVKVKLVETTTRSNSQFSDFPFEHLV